ncbi:unnamed protein product, partial [Rotaria magnacalcarata]
MWSVSGTKNNSSGKSLADLLTDDPNLVLVTPSELPTYRCPKSYAKSTLDLTFMSGNISEQFSVKIGPYLGSDHLPVVIESTIEINNKDKTCLPKWKLREVDWKVWKDELQKHEPYFPDDIEEYNKVFTQELIEVSSKVLKMKVCTKNPQYVKPWWSEECSRAVALSRRAYNK